MADISRQRLWAVTVGVAAVLACSCDRTKVIPDVASPTTPSATPQEASPLIATLTVKVDGALLRDPLAIVSDVQVDIGASGGSGDLRYTVDFGDDSPLVSEAASHHTYTRAGAFRVEATISDGANHRATATQALAVKTFTGTWFHAGWNPRARKFERRLMVITDQEGASVRGFYGVTSTPDRVFSGTLGTDRRVDIAVQGGESLEGTVPDRLNVDSPWSLRMHGGQVDGAVLPFLPVLGTPTSSPPDAVLKVTANSYGDSVAIAGHSITTYDASASRGEGLSYVIEFGDGDVSSAASATHVFKGDLTYFPFSRIFPPSSGCRFPNYALECDSIDTSLWVVDRYGRVDSERIPLHFYPIVDLCCPASWIANTYGEPAFLRVFIEQRLGDRLSGTLWWTEDGVSKIRHFTAGLVSERNVHIVVDETGDELDGVFRLSEIGKWVLTLEHTRGTLAGRVWTLRFDSGY